MISKSSTLSRWFKTLLFLSLFMSSFAQAAAEISSFNMVMRVNKDAKVSIREIYLITQEEGDVFKFPFTRVFPRHFVMEDGFPQEVKYKFLVVTDGFQHLNYKISKTDEQVRVDVGSEGKTSKSSKLRIIIEYEASNVIQFYRNYDMIRWQALYNSTKMPIKRSKITMYTPENSKIVSHESVLISNNKESMLTFFRKVSKSGAYIYNHKALNTRDGIEFMLSWPSGYVKPPSFYEKTMRILLRYPIYVLYVVLLSFYLWSFIYIFCFQTEKNPISFLQRLSPGTIHAICKEKFNASSIFYSIVHMAGLGAITIDYRDGIFYLNFRDRRGLPNLERKLYNLLQSLSIQNRLRLSELSMTFKDWQSLAECAAEEIKLPKAEKQKRFFHFIFAISAIVLVYTFSRYDPLFCMAILYLLVIIPLVIQRYYQKWAPFAVPTLPSSMSNIKTLLYGTNIFISILLLGVSFHELDYLIYRAPDREYEIFKIIGLLNYASTAVYIMQAQKFFNKLKRSTGRFREYMTHPEDHGFNDSRVAYDATKLFGHFLPHAMIFKSERKLTNYCVATNVKMGGGQYKVNWITIDNSQYNSFDEICDVLQLYLLVEMKNLLSRSMKSQAKTRKESKDIDDLI